ncbi:MAG: hypothetical protein K5633_05880 [Paludibacteraceae bacterium]|nr:hypothetical protein [Paludibacteraceae bacterium]
MQEYTHDELRYLQSLYEKENYENLCANPGLGMAPANVMTHQKIQMRFVRNFLKRFGFNVEILTETRLSDRVWITPDISIWQNFQIKNKVVERPVLSIEITHTRCNDRYSDKTIMMSFDIIPSLLESFIYNFTDNTWLRYFRDTDGEIYKQENQDYSQVLRCHLHTLMK